MAEEKLRLLANWLLKETLNTNSHSDNQLEQAIKNAKIEVKQEIGEYIIEVLNMTYREVLDELTGEEN
jgi:vacuolar-type H+-ATPase subunit E/Vma4